MCMNNMCSVQSERQPISVTGSVQSGWTSCVQVKVSDSLWVPQVQFKADERNVLSSKWATAYECHRLSPKYINIMCSVQSERQPMSATGSVQRVLTSCVTSKVSNSLWVSQTQFKLYERHVFSSKWALAYKCYRLSSKWMNFVCSVQSEDSLWVPQALFKVDKRRVLISKWATAYERHRLSSKWMKGMC